MFLVAGVTGNTGSVVASSLLDTGHKVRVLVRSAAKAKAWAARGAEVFEGALDDPSRLAEALQGVEAAYLLAPPDAAAKDVLAERRPFLDRIAQTIASTKLGHLVFLSSIGAQHEAGTGMIRIVHHAEQALGATGVPVTFLRAAYFIENWGAVLPAAKQDGVLPSFIRKSQQLPMVATADIGETAAQALRDGAPRSPRIIELAGPVDLAPDDVAAALSRLLGRSVSVAEAPPTAAVATFTSFGMTEGTAKLYAELYEGIANGKVSWEGSHESVRGGRGLDETLVPLLG
jgi:uncharacterized protein YbjT (DUF2867 family)